MAARTPPGPSSGLPDPDLSLKKRARRRIIGAVALALSAAIVLPLVLDSEPRQVRSDIQIRIPSRDTPVSERADGSDKSPAKESDAAARATAQPAVLAEPADRAAAKPGTAETAAMTAPAAALAAPGAAPAPVSSGKASALEVPKARPEPKPELKPERKSEPKPEPKAAVRAEPKPEPKAPSKSEPKPVVKAEPKPEPKPEPRIDPKPAAKPEAKSDPSAASFQLQVGAFASEKAAIDQVERVRRLGAKAYTERIKTDQGDRFRVRVGPYPGRDAAEQARGKLRAAGVEVSVVAP